MTIILYLLQNYDLIVIVLIKFSIIRSLIDLHELSCAHVINLNSVTQYVTLLCTEDPRQKMIFIDVLINCVPNKIENIVNMKEFQNTNR